ncbi:MAG: M28 family peptidase, partial [Sedimentisphaerales bacterium]|nr:M28 family peptidase [Sedimentisphaerales bacterium]
NFIGFVSNVSSGGLTRKCVKSFRSHSDFPCVGGAIPAFITGIGWSDHWSFWQEGYPALMVTDTAPFRYEHYHQPTDTIDKITFNHFAQVVAGLENVILDITQ